MADSTLKYLRVPEELYNYHNTCFDDDENQTSQQYSLTFVLASSLNENVNFHNSS